MKFSAQLLKTTNNDIMDALRFDVLQRYRLIEIITLWEGRLTTNRLREIFGISRQQASKDIGHYNDEISALSLIYDSRIKGYVPSPRFKPRLTKGNADEYLQFLQDQQIGNTTLPDSLVLNVPSHNINPSILRPIIQAVRQKKSIKIDYVSMTSPEGSQRIISPHTLVNTGQRWHVRAYCHQHQDYRDFVLSRFRRIPEPCNQDEQPYQGIKQDKAWNKTLTLKIKPHPQLTKAQQTIVETDYGMIKGYLTLKVRAACAQYLLQLLRIDPNSKAKATAQQVVLSNANDVEAYLF